MDYEKKYNESLERARNLMAMYPQDAPGYKEVFPELAESEDERIRKALIDFFGKLCDMSDVSGVYAYEVVVWLEKQKEQKPISTEDMPYITDEHFYEREPADSFKYKLAEYMTKCCTKKEGTYGYEYGISAETILKMAEEELLKRGVVQKPAEWSDEDENIRQALILLVSNDKKNGYTEFYKAQEITCDKVISFLKKLKQLPTNEEMLRTLRVEYEKGVADTIAKYEQKEQKPAEWSEEDKHNLNSVINLVHATTDGAWGSIIGVQIENWLKSLPKRFSLQPKGKR